MRRLIYIIALLYGAPAWATISVVQNGSATAATATISATQAGDLILVCGNRASNTEPSVPAGALTIKHATGANTQSGTCIYWLSVGAQTSTGTLTNATNVGYVVVRGYQIQSGGVLGCNPAQSNGSSTSLTYPTCSMTRTDGSSMLVTFGTATGAGTTPPDSCPTGPGGGTMTLQSSTSQSTIALCTLVGATSATTVNSVTIGPTTGHCGFTFEILGAANNTAITASDYLVYEKTWRFANEAASTPFAVTIPVEHATGSGNYLTVSFAWGYASVAPTVTSVKCGSTSFTLTSDGTHNAQVLDTGDTTDLFDYSISNASSGVCGAGVPIIITPSSAWTNFAARVTEYRQIATSSPIEFVAAQTSTNDPYQTAGAVTPVTSGDLIYQDCSSGTMGGVSGGAGVTSINTSGGATTLGVYPLYNLGSEAFIYGSTTATSEYMAFLPAAGNHAVCTAVALKVSAGAGTAPTGVQIVSDWNVLMTGVATNTNPYAIMGTGDAVLVLDDGNQVANAQQFTGLTDTIANTFAVKAPHDTSAGYPNLAFDCNATAGNDLLTFTGVNTGATHNQWIVEVRGLDNSSHTACWDSTTGVGGCSGGSCVSGTPTAIVASTSTPSGLPSITPGTADGIVFATSEIGTGTPQSLTGPTCGKFDNDTYPGQTDQSRMGLGNFFGYCLNSSTSAQTWAWINGTSDTFQGIGIHLKPAATPSMVQRRR